MDSCFIIIFIEIYFSLNFLAFISNELNKKIIKNICKNFKYENLIKLAL